MSLNLNYSSFLINSHLLENSRKFLFNMFNLTLHLNSYVKLVYLNKIKLTFVVIIRFLILLLEDP